MVNYEDARVTLTSTQLNKLKSIGKYKIRTTLRIIKKNFQDEELPNELVMVARKKTEIRNAFANNMSIDVKSSKAQLSKTIQPSGFVASPLMVLFL